MRTIYICLWHNTSFLGWLHNLCAVFLGKCLMTPTSPISWCPQANLGLGFIVSYNGLSGPSTGLLATHLVSAAFWSHREYPNYKCKLHDSWTSSKWKTLRCLTTSLGSTLHPWITFSAGLNGCLVGGGNSSQVFSFHKLEAQLGWVLTREYPSPHSILELSPHSPHRCQHCLPRSMREAP